LVLSVESQAMEPGRGWVPLVENPVAEGDRLAEVAAGLSDRAGGSDRAKVLDLGPASDWDLCSWFYGIPWTMGCGGFVRRD
jgi:hypothetical protein